MPSMSTSQQPDDPNPFSSHRSDMSLVHHSTPNSSSSPLLELSTNELGVVKAADIKAPKMD
jgi:hypothetical protein